MNDLFTFENNIDFKSESKAIQKQDSTFYFLVKSIYHNKPALFGFVLMMLIFLCALIIPAFTSDPLDFTGDLHHKPSSEYWFGTDYVGRDLFARVWHGLRLSLLLGLITTSINIIVAICIGTLMGYYPHVDKVMKLFTNILYSIPIFLILILLTLALGSGLPVMILGLTITAWVGPTLQVRSQILRIKDSDYTLASKTLGTKDYKIISSLILLIMPTIINQFIVVFPKMILFEATLGFLGLTTPDVAMLGNVISDGRQFIIVYPHESLIPVSFLVLSVLSTQLFANGVQDAFSIKGGDF